MIACALPPTLQLLVGVTLMLAALSLACLSVWMLVSIALERRERRGRG